MLPWELRHGDALDVLATLPAASVQCVVTSPPYFGLRSIGIDLNAEYLTLAERRLLGQPLPLEGLV